MVTTLCFPSISSGATEVVPVYLNNKAITLPMMPSLKFSRIELMCLFVQLVMLLGLLLIGTQKN